MTIDREIDKRQIDSGGCPVNTVISLLFILIAFMDPDPETRGKAKGFFTKIQRASKASSNYTLGQSLPLVGTL